MGQHWPSPPSLHMHQLSHPSRQEPEGSVRCTRITFNDFIKAFFFFPYNSATLRSETRNRGTPRAPVKCPPCFPTQTVSSLEITYLHCHALTMSCLCIQTTNKPAEIQLRALPQKSEVYLENYAVCL